MVKDLIEDENLSEKFIYGDLLNCGQDFYKTTKFLNYDQFIISLLDFYKKDQQKCGLMFKDIPKNNDNQGIVAI